MLIEDEGILLSKAKYSESSFVVTFYTLNNGIIKGLVKGGTSSKNRHILEIGNILKITKNNHSAEKLGSIVIEPCLLVVSKIFDDNLKLLMIASICSLIYNFVLEHEVDCGFYNFTKSIVEIISKNNNPVSYVLWELELLKKIGFGLDLTQCVVSKSTTDLYYISPKTGKSVTKEVGEKYKDKLFVMPKCFQKILDISTIDNDDVLLALDITNYFFNKFSFEYSVRIPPIREIFLSNILSIK